MAIRIPVIDRQVSIPGEIPQPRQSLERAGAGAGQVADAAFGFARQAIAMDEKIREQRDIIDVSRALADARLHWVRRSQELEAAAPADGAGYEQQFTQEFSDYQKQALERLSPTARPFFQTRIEGLQSQLLGRAMEFERGKRVAAQVNAFVDTQNKSLAAVYQDAGQFEPVIGDLTATIKANAYLPSDKKEELLRTLQGDAAVALLSGLIDRDQLNDAKRRLSSGEFNLALGPRGLNAFSDQLQRAFDRREARAAAAERSRLAQLAVTVRSGIRDDMAAADARGAGAGRGGAWLVSEEQIRAVLQPEQADQVIDQRDAAVELHNARLQLRTATPEEAVALLQAAQPKEGPGYAKAQRRYNAFLSAARERVTQLGNSPGDYAVMNDPGVAAAFARAEQDPQQSEAAARLTLHVQERLGVPVEAREVLGASRAKQLAARLAAVSPDDAVKALDRDGLPRQFGESWPIVYAELQRAGLSGAVIALPLVSDPVAKTVLATAARTPLAELKKAATPEIEKDLNKALDSALVPLRRSLARAPDGTQRGNDLRDAIAKMSLIYVQGGQSPQDAVKLAYDQVVGRNYEFDSDDGFRVRKPFTVADARKAVDVMLQQLNADSLQTPPPSPGALGALPDAERRRALLNVLRNGGVTLATNETDNGLVLLDRTGTPVKDKDGRRLELLNANIPNWIKAGKSVPSPSTGPAPSAFTEAAP